MRAELGSREIGAPLRRREASAASSTLTISSPSAAFERGAAPVRIACAKSCSSRLSGSAASMRGTTTSPER